ncbi:MAG: acyl-CoA synthetase [Actinocatenispora sp.]
MLLPALDGSFGDHPDAVRVGDDEISWRDLAAAGAAVADRITGASAVAVDATAGLSTVVAVVGALRAGVPLVPLPADSGPVEREHLLTDSGSTVLLSGRELDVSGLPVEVVPVDVSARSDSRHPEPAGDRTALILYTSGTTGAPKGVVLTRDAIAADLDGLAEAWSWTPDDVLVHGLPLYHVHGLVLGVLGALRVGSRLVHTVRPKPEAYAAAGGTLFFGVPTVWSRMCQDPGSARRLASARLLVSGSAPLPAPVFERLHELTGHRAVERYGMTETIITLSTRADAERHAGQVGMPVAGIRTRLVTEAGDPVPHDGESLGELQVRGATLFSGYLNRPDATAAAFTADGWFRTGDIATVDATGCHRIVGRSSTDLIKTGGYRVGAGEVENALLNHPAVREAAVVGRPHDDLGEQIVAYVVADDVSAQQLIDFVASQLSAHKRPRQVHLVGELPRNAMGKVQKRRLPTP